MTRKTEQESGKCYQRKDSKHVIQMQCVNLVQIPNVNKLKRGISETIKENETQIVLY